MREQTSSSFRWRLTLSWQQNLRNKMKELFAVILNHGTAWQASRSLEEQQDWEAHRSFMNALEKEGFVVLGGPRKSKHEVLLIFRATTPEEIVDRLSADPWHRRDLLRVSRVTRWELRLGSLPLARITEDRLPA